MLTTCINNDFDANYKCLGEPYGDDGEFHEAVEKVCDSGNFTDLSK